jgi:hypothetical protein
MAGTDGRVCRFCAGRAGRATWAFATAGVTAGVIATGPTATDLTIAGVIAAGFAEVTARDLTGAGLGAGVRFAAGLTVANVVVRLLAVRGFAATVRRVVVVRAVPSVVRVVPVAVRFAVVADAVRLAVVAAAVRVRREVDVADGFMLVFAVALIVLFAAGLVVLRAAVLFRALFTPFLAAALTAGLAEERVVVARVVALVVLFAVRLAGLADLADRAGLADLADLADRAGLAAIVVSSTFALTALRRTEATPVSAAAFEP